MAAPEDPTRRRRRPALPWQAVVAATVLAFTAAAMVFVFLSSDEDPVGDDASRATLPLRPVDEVPSDPMQVEYTDVDGTTGTLADRAGETPLVVNFFAEWCTPCVKEMPDFEAVHRELGDEVEFFGLAVNDRPEDTARIVEQTGITYDWSRDIRGDLATAAGIPQLPATMFVAADGTLAAVHMGALDREELRNLIEEHLGVAP